MTDEDHHTVVFLRPIGKDLCAAEWRHRVGTAAGDSNVVVEGLKRVLKDKELLVWVGLAQHLRVVDEVCDHRVLTNIEALMQTKAFHHHLHLEERLLTGVVKADVAGFGDAVGNLEEHCGLAGAGGTGKHHHRGGNDAITAERVVEPRDVDLLAVTKLLRDLELVDICALLETFNTHIQVHFRHVVELRSLKMIQYITESIDFALSSKIVS